MNNSGNHPTRCRGSLHSMVTKIAAAALLLSSPQTSTATKHSFTTKHDRRHLIGPISTPFGFLTGGEYSITVYDFVIETPSDPEGTNTQILRDVEAGFLLQRFESESHFSTYYETIMENPSACVFESHRIKGDVNPNADDDLLQVDDAYQIHSNDNGDSSTADANNAGESGVYLSMNEPKQSWKPNTPSTTHKFTNKDEEGLYFLLFQLCPRGNNNLKLDSKMTVSFELDLTYKNYDTLGYASYLTAGEMPLPHMFLYFSISYGLLFGIWVNIIRKAQGSGGSGTTNTVTVHAIHHLMTMLLGLKVITVFFEAARYHYIRMNGHAEFWSAIYFVMSFIKGTFMFTVILLIGSGWSFVKPFLNDKEKKIIWAVLFLQVIDNLAVVILSQETEGEKLYEDWSTVLHLVDILCCCAVLVPIVWQVNSLEKSVQQAEEQQTENDNKADKSVMNSGESEEGSTKSDAAHTLQKLKQFRSFYLMVVIYIYFTRIAVYLFAIGLGFRYTWLRYFVAELGTLAFYAVVGILFRPMADNPYLEVRGDVEIEFV